MFGLFKRQHAAPEPMQIAAEVEIAKSCEEVYALLDFADERNAKRALGYDVTSVGDNRWQMTMSNLPELTFLFDITEAVPGNRYAFDCIIEPALPNMIRSSEAYTLEPLGADKCHVTLLNTVELRPDMKKREHAQEVAMLAASTHSALQKFKLQAEHGAAATKAIENNTLI